MSNETEWFDRFPGDGDSPLSKQVEDGSYMMVIGEADYVRLPAELGGNKVKIIRTYRDVCPVTKQPNCLIRELEGGIYVSESSDKFYWFRPNVSQDVTGGESK